MEDSEVLDDETHELLAEALRLARRLCSKLKVPQTTLSSMLDASDWSFFVQGSALLEAGINHVLAKRVGIKGTSGFKTADELSSFVEKLPLRGRSGRLGLLKLTGIFTSEMLDQIEAFAIIRNAYAHDVRAVSLPCHELLRTLPESQQTWIIRALMLKQGNATDDAESVEPFAKLVLVGLLARMIRADGELKPSRKRKTR